MGMDALATIGRVALVIINILFLIISFVLMVLGFLLRFGQPLLDKYLLPQVQGTLTSLKTELGIDIESTAFQLKQIENIAIALIIIGLFLFVLSCFGCCGACCKVRWMLLTYMAVLSAIIVTQVLLVILLVSRPEVVKSVIRDPMKKSLQALYTGFTGLDPLTLGWNAIMSKLKCCGVDNYKDFDNAIIWDKTYNYDVLGTGVTVELTLDFPLICCELDGEYPGGKPIDVDACRIYPYLKANIAQGCFATIQNKLNNDGNFRGIVIGVGVTILGIEICMVIFAAWLYHKTKKNTKVYPSG